MALLDLDCIDEINNNIKLGNNALTMIEIENLHHHPENPRKTIDDIEELTESIKQNGILQNLTVVPIEDKPDQFYILIGNRRYEASVAAGLKELPCKIVWNMPISKQIETMLCENMQRTDLTLAEQVKGFEQLTLAGYSVDDISNATGFSKSTIYKRKSAFGYSFDELDNAFDSGITLDDFALINKSIANEETKKKIIKDPRNFKWDIRRYAQQEKDQIKFDNNLKSLKAFATELKKQPDLEYFEKVSHLTRSCSYNNNEYNQIQFDDDKEYYFYLEKVSKTIYVFYKLDESQIESRSKEEIRKKQVDNYCDEQIRKCCNIFNLYNDKRDSWIYEQLNDDLIQFKKKELIIALFNVILSKSQFDYFEVYRGNFNIMIENFKDILIENESELDWDKYYTFIPNASKNIYNDIFKFINELYTINKNELLCYFTETYNAVNVEEFYNKSYKLIMYYDFLKSFGYEPDKEELKYINGTHSVYKFDRKYLNH